ncbi:uncharacterized protein LOC133191542 [Saccostrea echinata]|uniref:uncharacterized protein LOC133191542 n=1 Tax=Saccostrea echinata TaxID=191078 RepID=UPI002A7FD250|nr:uncharacterized protein LOC133191542 [Saccostrea echinata]
MAGGNAPAASKVASVFIGLGFLLFVVGFGAPYWEKFVLGGNGGLWQRCGAFLGLDGCKYYTDLDDVGKDTYLPDWFESVRVFEAIGLVAALVGLVFLVLYVCVSKTSGNKIVALLTAIVTLGTGGVILLGVIIFGSNKDTDYLDWAFALAAVGGCFYVIAGVLLFVSMCSK